MTDDATNRGFCLAADLAEQRPAFLASVFARLKAAERIQDHHLAVQLGVTPSTLCRIAVCLRPRTETFRDDVFAIANRFDIDPSALARMIRLADSLDAIRQGASAEDGLLAAARDADDLGDHVGEERER